MILVLSTGGLLKLPETGYQLYVRPGVVVRTVFALWTDKLAMQSAKPSQYNDFYTVKPDSQDKTDDENAREDDGH
ncbi:hypothetical protein BDW02DRAFT_572626, partial [Decorospora gaudefroyi]